MAKNLVIVESPAKAKTIEKYLGKDFKVKSSFGHIRDLPKKGMSIDIESGTFAPDYQITTDKKKVVAELRKEAKTADIVWLATDDDREGEAIAWHLAAALKLTDKNSKRIVFREITKTAVLKAVDNPGQINMPVVDAQQARRVLDRLVGYELSPVLWKKVRYGLSAGRVQSVAVRLIVEKEREVKKHESKDSYRLKLRLEAKGVEFEAVIKDNLKSAADAKKLSEKLADSEATVKSVEAKDSKRTPPPPFTTSTLQQAASSGMGMSVKQTMTLAQRLYEQGHITYMRTDSLNLSNDARAAAKSYITKTHGQEYYEERFFKGKAGAQEAHEAIRPTDVTKLEAGQDAGQIKLYKLIRGRMLASQMAPSKIKNTTAQIEAGDTDFVAKGSVVVFPGYLKEFLSSKDNEELPEMAAGDKLDVKSGIAKQTFTKPTARYTEASLVKKLEELGIGRPSTYAPTISTIQARGYVEKSAREGTEREVTEITLDGGKVVESKILEKFGSTQGKLTPTDIAEVVTDFLVENFSDIVDYDFTKDVEEEFDKIANGKEKWNAMIKDWYGKFHKEIEAGEDIDRSQVMKSRELGKDPKTGLPILAKMGRFGPMLQLGDFPKESEEKPKFAPIPDGETIDTVTMEMAIEAFKLPRVVGKTEDGTEITAAIGRFGPYLKYDGKFVSIKDDDPRTITEPAARLIVADHIQKEKEKYITRWEKEGIDVLNGRYGPYITNGKKNAKIPKDTEPKDITLEQAKQLIKDAPAKGARRGRAKKK